MARALGFSPVVIGLFALSLGTSSPVLAVAVQASAVGLPDMALGVVIGASLINLLLILGVGALIAPMPSAPKVVLRDAGTMLLASSTLVFLVLQAVVSGRDGVLLIGAFAVYAIIAVISDWRRTSEHSIACAEAERRGSATPAGGGMFALTVGGICLVLGAHFVAGGALGLAAEWRMPLATVSLIMVALAASLPVLVVTAITLLRGYTEIAIGHLITASVFNVFGALGTAAIVRPLSVSPMFAADAFMMLGASAFLVPLLATNWQLSRLKGALLVLAYVGYLGFIAYRQGLIG